MSFNNLDCLFYDLLAAACLAMNGISLREIPRSLSSRLERLKSSFLVCRARFQVLIDLIRFIFFSYVYLLLYLLL